KEFNNKVYVADDMNAAIECAFKVASTNDNILLSPACASFDEFSGFEQRGCAFKQKVACLF
ncbi:MAG: UDP-N-acetylmuramoyl-L-alanine--D-glutamate ligase, partial [Coriobacteriales bacterium]|nr:UDP-N-acetylmuramoyl-L-alanine--D-glutamate ligase [Coriobacteriales bacterium]